MVKKKTTEEEILAKLNKLEKVLFWREFGMILFTLGLSIMSISLPLKNLIYSGVGFFHTMG